MRRFHSVAVSFVSAWLAACIAAPEGEAPKPDAGAAPDNLRRWDVSVRPPDVEDAAPVGETPDGLNTLDAGMLAPDVGVLAADFGAVAADAGASADASAAPDGLVFAPRPPPDDLCAAFDALAPIELSPAGTEWHGAVELALVPGRYHVDLPQSVDYAGLARFVAPETGRYFLSFDDLGPSFRTPVFFQALSDCHPAASTGEGIDWPAGPQWAGPVMQVALAAGETLLVGVTGATGPMDVVLRLDSAPALPDDADCTLAPDLCPVGSYCQGVRCTPAEPVVDLAATLVRWSAAPPGWPEEDIVGIHFTWRGGPTVYYQLEGATPNGPARWRMALAVDPAWQEGDLHHGVARINLWGDDPAALTWRLRVLLNPAGAGPWLALAPPELPGAMPEGAPCGHGWPACADGLDCRDEGDRGGRCVVPEPVCEAPSLPAFVPDARAPNDDRHEATTDLLDGDGGRCPSLGVLAGAVFTAPEAGRWTFRTVAADPEPGMLCLSRGCDCDVEACSGPGGEATATLAAGESLTVLANDALWNPAVGRVVEALPAAPPSLELHLVPNEVAGVALQLVTDAPDALGAVRIAWLDARGETRNVQVERLDTFATPLGSTVWFRPQALAPTRYPGARVEVVTRDGLALAPLVVALEDVHLASGAPCLAGSVDPDCPAPEACVGPAGDARCEAVPAVRWPGASLMVDVAGKHAWVARRELPGDPIDRFTFRGLVRVRDAQGRVLGAAPGWRPINLGDDEIWIGELSLAERRAIARAELSIIAYDRVQAPVDLPVVSMAPGEAGEPCAYPDFRIYVACAPGFLCGVDNRCRPAGELTIDEAHLTRSVRDDGSPGLLLTVRGHGATAPPIIEGHVLLADGYRPLGYSTNFPVDVNAAGDFEGTAEILVDVPAEWVVGYHAEVSDWSAYAALDVLL